MTPYNLQWLVKDRVVSVHLSGVIDMTVATSLSDELTTLLDVSTSILIHILVNDQQAVSVPKLPEMNRLRSSLQHPKVGWIVSVGANMNPVVKFISSLAIQIARAQFKRVASLEEAIEILKRVDTSIDWTAVQVDT